MAGKRWLAPVTGSLYTSDVRIIALKTLRDFWTRHPDSQQALRAWYYDVRQAHWFTPQ